MKRLPIIAVVTQETRLQGLKSRWVTSANVNFRMENAVDHEEVRQRKRKQHLQQENNLDDDAFGAMIADAAEALSDADELQEEDQVYQNQLKQLLQDIDIGYPIKNVGLNYVPNFDFERCVLVVAFGRDGLVANVAKYVKDVPILGVNPDPTRNDGILLPFQVKNVRASVQQAINQSLPSRAVTLAEVNTNDGQHMLAFNDFFIGCKSHRSARYTVELNLVTESQSSSGIIVSTGAGSTGWMSSVFNMAERWSNLFGGGEIDRPAIQWEDRRLLWAVREPFISRHSSADLIGGMLNDDDELVIGSQMAEAGVVFSDGVESDFIEFNSGSIARFGVSSQRAILLTQHPSR